MAWLSLVPWCSWNDLFHRTWRLWKFVLWEPSLYFLFLFIVSCSLQIVSSLMLVSLSAISSRFRRGTGSLSMEPVEPVSACLCPTLTASLAVFPHLLVPAPPEIFAGVSVACAGYVLLEACAGSAACLGCSRRAPPSSAPWLAAWRHHTAAAVSSAPSTRRVLRRSHAGRQVALPAQPFAASAHCRPCWVKGPQDIAAPLSWLLRFSRNPPARYRNDVCYLTDLHLLLSGAG